RGARLGRALAAAPRRGRRRLRGRGAPHLRRPARGMTGGSTMNRALGWLAAVGLAGGLVMAFGVAPREVTQGNVQRIMHLHVPTVLVAYLAFGVVLLASIAYLWRRDPAADRLAHASAEVGV